MLFENLEIVSNTDTVQFSKDTVAIQKFATVHPDDHEPVTIIGPDLKDGPWIAGGAALQWYQGRPVLHSDIDVFCSSEQQIQDLLNDFYSRDHTKKWSSDNAETFDYNRRSDYKSWRIQIIKRRTFKSIQDVINSFDISVCQVATAGNEYIMGPHTIEDIRTKKLRMKMPLQADAVKRYTKYVCYGYIPDPDLCKQIVENSESKWNFNMQEDYNNAF